LDIQHPGASFESLQDEVIPRALSLKGGLRALKKIYKLRRRSSNTSSSLQTSFNFLLVFLNYATQHALGGAPSAGDTRGVDVLLGSPVPIVTLEEWVHRYENMLLFVYSQLANA
jgi:hypothetical protein